MHYCFCSNFSGRKKIFRIQTYLFTSYCWGRREGLFLPVSSSTELKIIEKLTPEEFP